MSTFLKWAGNKTGILPEILSYMPKTKGWLIEPFVGSGAVYIGASGFTGYIINDINPHLIGLYEVIKGDDFDEFLALAQSRFTPENNTADFYYNERDRFNTGKLTKLDQAATFLYLNKHCYNGLVRYNAKGGFNTSFGDNEPYFPENEMNEFRSKMNNHLTMIGCGNFAKAFGAISAGDVIYCDPPYIPASTTANFTSYAGNAFTLENQKQLARLCESARNSGATVLVSNSDTPESRQIFARASKIVELNVSRKISCKANERKKAKEILAIYE